MAKPTLPRETDARPRNRGRATTVSRAGVCLTGAGLFRGAGAGAGPMRRQPKRLTGLTMSA